MYNVVTIEREYASGGNEIGKRLAARLGYKLYDRNILIEASKKLEIPAYSVEELEETGSGGMIFNLSKTPLGGFGGEEGKLPLAERLFLEEKRIVERIAEEGNCVIVGRAAAYILRERQDCLKVFIHADRAWRLKRAVRHEGVKPEDAEAVLKKNDKRRRGFYDTNTQWRWGSQDYFEVCLDSGRLGLEVCEDMLRAAIIR